MKSKQMLDAILNRWSDVAYSAGLAQAKHEADAFELECRFQVSYDRGAASRDDEVEELRETCNELTNTVREYIDANAVLESKLSDQHLDSYNAGVQNGRESAVTKATVNIMTDAAARTIFAGERWR